MEEARIVGGGDAAEPGVAHPSYGLRWTSTVCAAPIVVRGRTAVLGVRPDADVVLPPVEGVSRYGVVLFFAGDADETVCVVDPGSALGFEVTRFDGAPSAVSKPGHPSVAILPQRELAAILVGPPTRRLAIVRAAPTAFAVFECVRFEDRAAWLDAHKGFNPFVVRVSRGTESDGVPVGPSVAM
jgi:hypothetical protein